MSPWYTTHLQPHGVGSGRYNKAGSHVAERGERAEPKGGCGGLTYGR